MHACSIDCRKGVERGGKLINEKVAGQQFDVEGVFIQYAVFHFAYSTSVCLCTSLLFLSLAVPQRPGNLKEETVETQTAILWLGVLLGRVVHQTKGPTKTTHASCPFCPLYSVVSSTVDGDNKTWIQTSLDLAHTLVWFLVLCWPLMKGRGTSSATSRAPMSLVPCPASCVCPVSPRAPCVFRVPWVRVRRNTGYVALPYISDLQILQTGTSNALAVFNLLVERAKQEVSNLAVGRMRRPFQ